MPSRSYGLFWRLLFGRGVIVYPFRKWIMKLLSYASTRPGLQGIGSVVIRIGVRAPFSHTEILFEEEDGVDDLMPDNTTATIDGSQWIASATASDRMPLWAPRRKGRIGGVRFKRIKYDKSHWISQDLPREIFDPRAAAKWFRDNEGQAYDWRQIASFVGSVPNIIFNHSQDKYTCTESVAAALGFPESHRYNPGNLPNIIHRFNHNDPASWNTVLREAKDILKNT